MFSAFPFAAYQAIWNEYYRDQNLIEPTNYKLNDGANDSRWFEFEPLRSRAWQHDYFTASLPWAQKGDPISLPIAGFNDVEVAVKNGYATRFGLIRTSDQSGMEPAGTVNHVGSFTVTSGMTVNGKGAYYDPNETLIAKTSEMNTSAVTINDLRVAIALQQWLEVNARAGS